MKRISCLVIISLFIKIIFPSTVFSKEANIQPLEVDQTTGNANFSYPISVPAGRGGMQPNIVLNYSSSVREGILGVGWNLELGSIQRSTKKGVPNYDNTDAFMLTMPGMGSQELVFDPAAGFYHLQTEGSFLRIQKIDNSSSSWQIIDSKGTKYFFGRSANSQVVNSQNLANIFKWHLDRVEDINGNFMTMTYARFSDGVLYPQQIDYTGNAITGALPYAQVLFDLEDKIDSTRSNISGAPVDDSKRIKSMRTYVNGNLQGRYDLTYAYSPVTTRSLLSQIQFFGSDGITGTPPVAFTYQNSDMGFTLASGWTIPDGIKFSANLSAHWGDLGVRLADVNSDGFPDFVRAFTDCAGNTIKEIYLHNKINGWALTTQWSLPAGLPGFVKGCSDIDRDNGVRFVDINEDGWVDIVWFLHNAVTGVVEQHVYVNNKTNGWTEGNSSLPNEMAPVQALNTPVPDFRQNMGVQFSDVNGDGQPDLVKAKEGYGQMHKTYLNRAATNQDWLNLPQWTPFGSENGSYLDFTDNGNLVDLSGDGLPDLFWKYNGVMKFARNLGKGWSNEAASWINTDGYDATTQFVDINGDGLEDLVTFKGDYTNGSRVFVNKWNGWIQLNAWIIPGASFQNLGTRFLDANGDGMLDALVYPDGSVPQLYLNKGNVPDLLTEINNGVGGRTQITYGASQQTCPNSFFPFHIQVVKSVTVLDGFGNSYATNYSYAKGLWDTTYREFRGFGKVTVTDPNGNYVVTQYLQDPILKGQVSDQATYDSMGKMFSKVVNTWSSQNIVGTTANFVFLSRQDKYTYDGQTTGRRSAALYFYEESPQLGHLTREIQQGEVDINTGAYSGSGSKTIETTYANNVTPSNYLHGFPKIVSILNDQGTLVGKNFFYYDNQLLDASPIKGQLTKKENWAGGGTAVNPTNLYEYDPYGNVISTTDANGNKSTVTFDPLYHFFPLITQNALGRQGTNVYYGVNGVPLSGGGYQGLWGQTKSSTDANGQTIYQIYDVLGRLVAGISPLDSLTYPTTQMSYAYTSQYSQITKKQRVKSGAATTIDTVEFYDGLGRLIENKSLSEVPGRFVVSGHTEYNSRGLPVKKFLPFFVTTAQDTIDPLNSTRPYTSLSYDPLGRLTQTVNPDGTFTTVAISNWTVAATDENGHLLKSYYDAFGRLIKKEEYLGADGRSANYPNQSYLVYATTLYTYDSKDNLIKVTDHQGNITTITYDGLSRKTQMKDPDMGTWQYGYDLNGNLKWQIDAKNVRLDFTYDKLNRLTLKTDGGSVNVSYTYDDPNKSFSKGRLSNVAYANGMTQFEYDGLGREIKSIKTIDSINYTVQRTYDMLNTLQTLQYPDGTVLTYKYDIAGQPSGVVNGTINYAKNVNYNELGQIIKITEGNNVTTTYTYFPGNFRLKKIKSTTATGTVVQDLNYTYDSLGDILTITDNVNSATQSFTYDHLNRLTQAVSPRYGTKTYVYNEIGNILNKEGVGYSYGAGAGPHAVTSLDSGVTFNYDLNGNMTKKIVGTETTAYVYNTESQLTTIRKNGAAILKYEYDGDGGRTKKIDYTLSGETTRYVGNLYELRNTSKSVCIYLGGKQIASIIDGQMNYFLQDHLGGANLVLSDTGAVKELDEYEPYGQFSRRDRVDPNAKLTANYFTNQKLDENGGLYYYGTRYYDPSLGRFIQPDLLVQAPGNPQTFNRYTYANNNPVNLIDPSGHGWFKKFIGKIVGAIVGTVAFVASGFNPVVGLQAYSLTDSVISGGIAISEGANPFRIVGSFAAGLAIGLGTADLIGGISNLGFRMGAFALQGAAVGAIGSAITQSDIGLGAAFGGGFGATMGFFSSQQFTNFKNHGEFLSDKNFAALNDRIGNMAEMAGLTDGQAHSFEIISGKAGLSSGIDAGHAGLNVDGDLFGFYPDPSIDGGTLSWAFGKSGPGQIRGESLGWAVGAARQGGLYSTKVNSFQANVALMQKTNPGTFSLATNCSRFALDTSRMIGINVPSNLTTFGQVNPAKVAAWSASQPKHIQGYMVDIHYAGGGR